MHLNYQFTRSEVEKISAKKFSTKSRSVHGSEFSAATFSLTNHNEPCKINFSASREQKKTNFKLIQFFTCLPVLSSCFPQMNQETLENVTYKSKLTCYRLYDIQIDRWMHVV
jgi:hypothetical protein